MQLPDTISGWVPVGQVVRQEVFQRYLPLAQAEQLVVVPRQVEHVESQPTQVLSGSWIGAAAGHAE